MLRKERKEEGRKERRKKRRREKRKEGKRGYYESSSPYIVVTFPHRYARSN